MNQQIKMCAKCGGAQLPPNVSMGYGGPICHCGVTHCNQPFFTAVWAKDPLIERLEHIENRLWKLENVGTPSKTTECICGETNARNCPVHQ